MTDLQPTQPVVRKTSIIDDVRYIVEHSVSGLHKVGDEFCFVKATLTDGVITLNVRRVNFTEPDETLQMFISSPVPVAVDVPVSPKENGVVDPLVDTPKPDEAA